jgi:GTP-binding protein HflX
LIDRPAGGERVILVHLHLRDVNPPPDLQEFHDLAFSAGAWVIESVTVNRRVPDAKYFIGSGKVAELKEIVRTKNIELVLFNHTLSPGQERNLERALQCRVLDRTGLILDIFAQRARSYEGKLQVELAQLKHLASRLVRGWTHLERQKGGIGLRGPGETQLEVDRRLIKMRIKYIKERLEKVKSQREQGRRARSRASFPAVSLVGYTNAGKSTLFNVLTGSEVYVANKLFATLDPTLRSVEIPPIGKIILADTVGFVRNLPHDLIEAFQATLEETQQADLLLHVIDSQDEDREAHIAEVEAVLEEIGALAVPRIEVYNKIDLSETSAHSERNEEGRLVKIFVSATQHLGLDILKEALAEILGQNIISGVVRLAPGHSRVRALLFDAGAVIHEEIDAEGHWVLTVKLPYRKWQELCMGDGALEKSLLETR